MPIDAIYSTNEQHNTVITILSSQCQYKFTLTHCFGEIKTTIGLFDNLRNTGDIFLQCTQI